MIVLGLGFRAGTTVAALQEVARRAAGDRFAVIDRLATANDIADHEAFQAFARAIGRPVVAVAPAVIAGTDGAAISPHIPARYGGRSVAEAAALAAAGPDARLLSPRLIAADGSATAALAEGDDP